MDNKETVEAFMNEAKHQIEEKGNKASWLFNHIKELEMIDVLEVITSYTDFVSKMDKIYAKYHGGKK